MIQQIWDEGLMIFWHAEVVGWMVCWKQGVEKTMETALAYETDIAYLHGSIRFPWSWPPQGMPVRWILDCKLFAEDVIVGHRDRKRSQESRKAPDSRGGEVGTEENVTLETCRTRMRGSAVHPKWHHN